MSSHASADSIIDGYRLEIATQTERAEKAEAKNQQLREALDDVGPLMEEAMTRPLWGSLQGTWQERARDWHAKHNATLRSVAAGEE